MDRKSSDTLYRKVVRGAKTVYEPVGEATAWDSFPYGTHIVTVAKGSMTRQFRVSENAAATLAQLAPLRERLIDLLHEASKSRPSSRLTSPSQREAWEQFVASAGDLACYLTYPSAMEIVDKLLSGAAQELERQDSLDAKTRAWVVESDPVIV